MLFLKFLVLCIGFFYSKDVRLPVQLQRAMAAEAEAAREARAKVSFSLKIKEGIRMDKYE